MFDPTEVCCPSQGLELQAELNLFKNRREKIHLLRKRTYHATCIIDVEIRLCITKPLQLQFAVSVVKAGILLKKLDLGLPFFDILRSSASEEALAGAFHWHGWGNGAP